MTATNDTQNRAKAESKEQRARDAAKAMQDYQAERLAVLARTARLRAERLAREAAGAVEAKSAVEAKPKSKAQSKTKPKSKENR